MVSVGHNRDHWGGDFFWEAKVRGASGKDRDAVFPSSVVVQAAKG